MKFGRITIGGLLATIAFVALSLAALRSHSLLWVQIVYTMAPASLLIVTIGAIVGRHRAIWIGAAVLGWGYWILVFAPGFENSVKPWLLTTRIIDEAFDRLVAPDIIQQKYPGIVMTALNLRFNRDEDRIHFLHIAQSLAVLVHMVEGAIVGFILNRYRTRSEVPK